MRMRKAVVFMAVISLGCVSARDKTTPVTPKALPAARAILKYMHKLPRRKENRVLSGQCIASASCAKWGYKSFGQSLETMTGKQVSIFGFDYGPNKGDAKKGHLKIDVKEGNRCLIDHWKRGGLVTISCHNPNPWTQSHAWDLTGADIAELLKGRNTPARKRYMDYLDHLAAGLKELQDAGVVVLWRPFHEMNGGWFWWCSSKPAFPKAETFIALWREQFHYFTKTKKLRNLPWVYAPSRHQGKHWKKPELYYYPGKKYVDIVGLDIYADDFVIEPDVYKKMTSLGKPFGLGEYGPSNKYAANGTFSYPRLINHIRDNYPKICFFQIWFGGGKNNWALAVHKNTKELLDDPWVVTRDELPEWGK